MQANIASRVRSYGGIRFICRKRALLAIVPYATDLVQIIIPPVTGTIDRGL